jgi:hypothetical protein
MNFFLKRQATTTQRKNKFLLCVFASLRLCVKKILVQNLIPSPASVHSNHTGVGANSIPSAGIPLNPKILHSLRASLRRTHFNFWQFQGQRLLVCVRRGAMILFRWWKQRFIFQRKDAKAQRRKEEENYFFYAFKEGGLA